MSRAWDESQSDDPDARHEEGGYIVQTPEGALVVERGPLGDKARIYPPPLDGNNCYNGRTVVATFHTHPNPAVDEGGQEWEQSPSVADGRWHERRNLGGFVISRMFVYEIDSSAGARGCWKP